MRQLAAPLALVLAIGVLVLVGASTSRAQSVASTEQCGLAQAAFCDTFDTPAGNGNRSGDLNGNIWGVSRTIGGTGTNFGQQLYDAWAPTAIQGCSGTTTVVPPHDILICNGQLREATNDNASGQFDNGDVLALAMYPKQPFDFAGRTGKVAFDVSNDSAGTHAAWPEFWLTDLPAPAPFTHFDSWQAVPPNALGIRFAASVGPNQFGYCPSFPPTYRWTVDSAAVVRNYVVDDTTGSANRTAMKVTPTDCVTLSSGPGNMNHVELDISQNQIDVYATDAGTTSPLKKIAVISNANLTLSRGLIWLEDVHYNADKGVQGSFQQSQRQHTFSWDNVGFDGPFTYQDQSYDALDNTQQMGPYQQINLGKFSNPNQTATWNVLNMPNGLPVSPTAQAVRVMFNFFHYAQPTTLSVTINGHPHLAAFPYPDSKQLTWRTFALTIPITDLIGGTNVVTVGGDQAMATANVNIVLVNVGGGAQPTATATAVSPTSTSTTVPTVTQRPTDTPVPIATAVPSPTDTPPLPYDCQVSVSINGTPGPYHNC